MTDCCHTPDRRPPINADWLTRFRSRPEFLARLFEVFLTEEPKRLARIQAAVHAGDLETVRFLAHALKGASATMGMERLSDACRALEYAVRDEEPQRLPACLAAVEREITAVFVVMRAG